MKPRIKYPRTPHLPWSPGGTADDAYLVDVAHFEGCEIVITEKLDGENTSLYRDGMHARSIDGRHHPSRDWIKAFHAGFAASIPEGWRCCGENVYARHSVAYEALPSYFLLFSIWNKNNVCLSWDDTCEWADLLGVSGVPVLYRGAWDEDLVRGLEIDDTKQEGYVIRLADRFSYDAFPRSIAKWVRQNHVRTDRHWMHGQIIPNKLAHGGPIAGHED